MQVRYICKLDIYASYKIPETKELSDKVPRDEKSPIGEWSTYPSRATSFPLKQESLTHPQLRKGTNHVYDHTHLHPPTRNERAIYSGCARAPCPFTRPCTRISHRISGGKRRPQRDEHLYLPLVCRCESSCTTGR
jgi:hypothetical protein